jgi:hypothetical protein
MDIYNFEDHPSSLKQQIIYERSNRRNYSTHTLQPHLSARPVQTKYTIMPIVSPSQQINTPVTQQPTYDCNKMYHPTNKGPWCGYASNINHESDLRNQLYPLSDCSTNAYIPSSSSSLYQVKWKNNKNIEQPFPNLFKTENFCPMNPNPNPDSIGYALFNNATRQQVKDLS